MATLSQKSWTFPRYKNENVVLNGNCRQIFKKKWDLSKTNHELFRSVPRFQFYTHDFWDSALRRSSWPPKGARFWNMLVSTWPADFFLFPQDQGGTAWARPVSGGLQDDVLGAVLSLPDPAADFWRWFERLRICNIFLRSCEKKSVLTLTNGLFYITWRISFWLHLVNNSEMKKYAHTVPF